MYSSCAMYAEVEKDPRDRRIVENPGSVKRIACLLISRLPSSVRVGDLSRAGMIGPIEAPGHYDPSEGASFDTCAGIRVRGAMREIENETGEQSGTIYGMPAAVAPIAEQILSLKEIGKKIALNS